MEIKKKGDFGIVGEYRMWRAKSFCISIKLDCLGAIGERSSVEREKWEGKEKRNHQQEGVRSRDVLEEGT